MKRILKKKLKVKAEYIYNPLSTKDLDSSKNTKKKFFKDQKNLKILFLGRLVDQKDPFTFLKSLKWIALALGRVSATTPHSQRKFKVAISGPPKNHVSEFLGFSGNWTEIANPRRLRTMFRIPV